MESANSTHGGYKGEYAAPKHKSSTVRGSYMSTESSGVGSGLSMRADCDTTKLSNVMYNNAVNPVNGNPRQVPKPYESTSVTEKGHKMKIC